MILHISLFATFSIPSLLLTRTCWPNGLIQYVVNYRVCHVEKLSINNLLMYNKIQFQFGAIGASEY